MITLLLLGIIYLAFISLGLPDAVLGAAIPAIHLAWGTPVSFFGTISIVITIGTIISSLTSAALISKVGTGRIVFISCFMTGSSLLGISLVPSFYWMIPLAIPLGLGGGAVDAALNNYVAMHFKAHHMNWLHSFWGVGATVGPLIMGSMIVSRTWQSGYRLIGIIQLSMAVLLLLSLPLWKRHKPEVSHHVLENAGTPSGRPAFRIPGVPAALVVMACYCAAEVGVGLWGSSFLSLERGYSVEAAALWMSMYYGGITIGRFLSGFFSFRLTNPQMIRLGLVIAIAGGLLLMIPLPPVLTGFLLVLIGLGFAPVFPAMLHETPVRFGVENSQKVIGLQMGFAYIGAAAVPPVMGVLIDHTGAFMLPILISVLIGMQFIFSERLNRLVRG